MARWQPNAPERLVLAALELFEERGYERTTVIEIAERAGLTKSSFFRHFQDKREVLFGTETITGLLGDGVAAAPASATPLEAVARALDEAGARVFTPGRREFVARRRAVIATASELREREALKGLAIAAALVEALRRRGVPALQASVAAQLGTLALGIAYERWSTGTGEAGAGDDADFGDLGRRVLDDVRAAAAAASAAVPVDVPVDVTGE